ncbi:class I SAM-dependent methyltransferase [Pseudoalteromonas rubra]|uniref:Methyltransferase domain-containing protein n=1 Tax=Pseudoalteromonas rubra TaxID=43658 RepID=A0A4V2E471_9GAMM|nr:methyltransferase domain-containing protein [Pseudoalteromonas rubra]RZM85214.1 hypothetical protein C3B51_00760 [Pseudoalteromonas rubra]
MSFTLSHAIKVVLGLVFMSFLVLLLGCSSAMSKLDYSNIFNRKGWNHTDKVVEKLALKKGDVVVDLGAGDGYFSYVLAEEVGSAGKVYAVDISQSALDKISKNAKERNLDNIYTVLAEEADPNLPVNDINMIFMSNSYHHISDRITYFKKVSKHLAHDGRLAVLDTKEGTPFFIIPHGVHAQQIRQELAEAGYKYTVGYDFLPFNNFQLFTK